MATRFYLRNTTANVGTHGAGELSPTLPVGTFDDAGNAAHDLSRSKGSAETSVANVSLGQTAQQSQYLGKFISEDLGAAGITDIGANTWNVRFRYQESSGFANAFLRVSIYVLKSDDTVRGFVYDGAADLGVEADATGQELTVSGAAVSGILSGDRLVCEAWIVAAQAMTGNYTNTVYYDGATDVVDATASDAASYIETPENLFPPSLTAASAGDSGRDWDAPYQELSLTFSEAMTKSGGSYGVGDTIPGMFVQVNGGAQQAVTYRSGEDTASWVVRTAVLIRNGDTVVIDYERATGELLSVSGSVELAETADFAVTNNLTKRIRAILKRGDGTVITTAVDCMVLEIGSTQRDSDSADWMQDVQKQANVTPSGAGLIDFQYTGPEAVGADKVYLAVFNPREDSSASSAAARAALWTHAVD